MKSGNLNFRINNQIRANEVRVLDSAGKQIGIMNLSKALELSRNEGVDLVEIAPMAKPPVVRVIELGKFKYEQEKKLKKQKKGITGGDIKEIRLSPFIAEHDFNNRLERIKEFLGDRNKVRLVVKFTGRQLGSKQFGYDVIKRILKNFEGEINLDAQPKFLGKQLMATISPLSKTKVSKDNNPENEKPEENKVE